MTDAALWLPVGAVALYLYDSLVLLYASEFVVEGRGARARVSRGVDILIGGRRPFLPTPWNPARVLFRLHWDGPGPAPAAALDIGAFEHAVGPLRWLVCALWLFIVGLLPIVCAVSGAGVPLLALFVAIYSTVTGMIVVLWRARTVLGIDRAQCLSLSADIRLCAPFAVNLVRKLSLRCLDGGDPVDFVAVNLGPAARVRARDVLVPQIDSLVTAAEDDAVAIDRLRALRVRLQGASSCE